MTTKRMQVGELFVHRFPAARLPVPALGLVVEISYPSWAGPLLAVEIVANAMTGRQMKTETMHRRLTR